MKKITAPKIALLAATPVSAGLIPLIASCSYLNIPKLVEPAETQLTANENNIAWVEVTFAQQPKGNEALISVSSNSGEELEIIDGTNSYESVDTIIVNDKKAMAIVGVKEKPSKSVNIDFDLNFSYIDANDKAVSFTIQHMKLQVDVDPEQTTDEVHMLSINDFHGCVPGYGSELYKVNADAPGILRLAKETHDIVTQYPGSVILSAGDNNSDYLYSAATHAETLFPMLKAMDVTYSAVGNHAWEWGSDYLTTEKFDQWGRTSSTSGKYFVTANVLNDASLQTKDWALPGEANYDTDYKIWQNQMVRWADPYKVLNMKGHRVCIIGLTTQKTIEDGNTDATKHLSFINYEAAVNFAKRACLENIGQSDYNRIESFILLTHVESEYDDPQNPTGAAIDLAKTISTPVDAIISAHSHKIGTAKVHNELLKKDIWVGQAGKFGVRFLDTKLELDNTKPTGQKLTNLEMTLHKPYIEYGGYDPESEEGKAAAAKQYKDLIDNPKDAFNANVVNQYKIQTAKVEEELEHEYATAEYDATYIEDKDIGHKYIWTDNVVELLGAWVGKAMLEGFANIYCEEGSTVAKPWIAFMNQDGILESWKQGDVIRKKNLFAAQPHDNKTVMGWLTIGQIWNIINYSLCGQGVFDYSQNVVYPGKLNKSLVDGLQITATELEKEKGTSDNTSCYLCGPLQTYGVKFELENTSSQGIYAKYQIKSEQKEYTTTGGITYSYGCPHMWFYDPTNDACKIDNPDTWIDADTYIKEEKEKGSKKLIPVLIPDFIYNGKLAANRMFKHYFLYCQGIDPDKKPVIYSQYTRDLLIEFADHWAKIAPLGGKFIMDPTIVNRQIVKPS